MIESLFFSPSVAQSMVVFSLCIITGLAFGSIRFGSISLGVGGVLFSGLALGHFGFSVESHILHFAREFGLILFVYSIGMQVGPGFLDSLKRSGFRLNLMATFIVLCGTLMSGAFFFLFDIPLPVIVGLYSGAVTNTPSLAAATQTFNDILPNVDMATEYINMSGLGYAVAYPLGILGIIATMLIVRYLFSIHIEKEVDDTEKERLSHISSPSGMTVEVTNPAVFNRQIGSIQELKDLHIVLSRVGELEKRIHTPTPDTILQKGMFLHGVGDAKSLLQFQKLIGEKSSINLQEINTSLESTVHYITKHSAVGKTIEGLGLHTKNGIAVTRITRVGVEFTAAPSTKLHFGDSIRIVADREGRTYVRKTVGDSTRMLEHPHVLPLFVGILVGVIFGSIPIFIPGLSSALKLGLAGGPLLVSIVLSRLHSVGGMICFTAPSANLMIREIGICLFLAAVGLNAGSGFVPILLNGSGFYWIGIGALITIIPLLVTAVIGRVFLRCDYPTLCGLVSGAMTDPPALAFAAQILRSNSAASVYATVYPLTMILRILSSQILVLFLTSF